MELRDTYLQSLSDLKRIFVLQLVEGWALLCVQGVPHCSLGPTVLLSFVISLHVVSVNLSRGIRYRSLNKTYIDRALDLH